MIQKHRNLLTIALGLILCAIASVKGLPPGLEFKSLKLCGKIWLNYQNTRHSCKTGFRYFEWFDCSASTLLIYNIMT